MEVWEEKQHILAISFALLIEVILEGLTFKTKQNVHVCFVLSLGRDWFRGLT